MDLNQNGDLENTFIDAHNTSLNVLTDNMDSSEIDSLVFDKSMLDNECDVLENKLCDNEDDNTDLKDIVDCSNKDLVLNSELTDELLLTVSYGKQCEDISLDMCRNEETFEETALNDAQQALQLWNCPKCSALFCDKDACSQHCEEAHNFVCGLCREPCDDKYTLESHIINHITSESGEELQKISKSTLIDNCTQTEFITFSPSESSDVNLKHLANNTVQLFEHLNNKNSTKIDLATNDDDVQLILEKEEHKHICEVCEKQYTSENALLLHLKSKHEDMPVKNIHKCEICGMLFQWKVHLTRHQTLKHGKERDKLNFHCQVCNKLFSSQESLSHHQKLHAGDFSFSCDFCEKKFGGSVEHLQHIKSAHPYSREFPCSVCGKSFKSKTFLNAHALEVHPDKCQLCEKFYKSPRALEEHMMIEHGCERKTYFTCQCCGKLFTKNETLLQHINMCHRYTY